jgi:hypothetical protein
VSEDRVGANKINVDPVNVVSCGAKRISTVAIEELIGEATSSEMHRLVLQLP